MTPQKTSFDDLGQPEWIFVLRSVYQMFATVACLGGNSVVLLASVKYNAVEIDEVSLALLQNLASADIMVHTLSFSFLFLLL